MTGSGGVAKRSSAIGFLLLFLAGLPGCEQPPAAPVAKPQAHLDRAAEALTTGQLDRAAAALEVAREAYGPSERLADLGLRLLVYRAATSPDPLDPSTAARVLYALDALGHAGDRPTDALLTTAAARLAWDAGQMEAAQAQLEQAVQLDASFAPGQVALGLLHRSAGRRLEALAAFEAAVGAAPGHTRTLNNLGVLYAELDRPTDALKTFEKALATGPDLTAHLNVARILTATGRHAEAVEHLVRAQALAPDRTDVAERLGAALWATGKLAEAKQALEAPARAGSPGALLTLARVAQHEGSDEAAAALFERVLRLRSDDYEAAFGLGFVLQRAGKKELAAQAYRQYLSLASGVASEASVVAEVKRTLAKLQAPD